MRYMLLIYGDPTLAETMTPEEGQKIMSDYFAFTQSIVESGELVSGEPLEGVENATTVRVRTAGRRRPTARSRRPRKSSAATTSSTARISTAPSSSPAASPARSTVRSRFAR